MNQHPSGRPSSPVIQEPSQTASGKGFTGIWLPLFIVITAIWWWYFDNRWGAEHDILEYATIVAGGAFVALVVSIFTAIAVDRAFTGGRQSRTKQGSNERSQPVVPVVEDQVTLEADRKVAAEFQRQLTGFRLAFIVGGTAIAGLCLVVIPLLVGDSPLVQVLAVVAGAFFALAGVLAALSLHMAAPNEVAVVFLLGRFRKQGRRLHGVRGLRKVPKEDGEGYEYETGGFFLTVPFLETIRMVSLRIYHGHFPSSLTQTRDQVAVNVEVEYYVRRSNERPELSVIAVEGSDVAATHQAAQIASRDMLGKSTLQEVSSDLRKVADAAQETLKGLVVQWGHEIVSLGMTDLNIVSEKVRDALSDAAEAGVTKEARVTISRAEKEVATNLDEASAIYQKNPQALLLRYMQVISDATKEGKATVVLPGNLEGLLGGLFKGLDYPARLSPSGEKSPEA